MKLELIAAVSITVALAAAIPARADDSEYLSELHKEYFSQRFTDPQLLAEGRKVCAQGNADELAIVNMVAADLGISSTAGATVVSAAHIMMGC